MKISSLAKDNESNPVADLLIASAKKKAKSFAENYRELGSTKADGERIPMWYPEIKCAKPYKEPKGITESVDTAYPTDQGALWLEALHSPETQMGVVVCEERREAWIALKRFTAPPLLLHKLPLFAVFEKRETPKQSDLDY